MVQILFTNLILIMNIIIKGYKEDIKNPYFLILLEHFNIFNPKKGQVIFKNNFNYKASLLNSRWNRFWKDLKKFRG